MDIPLSERGILQARALAERLAFEEIAAVYTSPLTRARQTALLLAQANPGAPPVIDVPEFIEVNVGNWEGKSFDEVRTADPDGVARWLQDTANEPFPGGESYERVRQRAMPLLLKAIAQHPDQSICVVSHAGPLKAIICDILGVDLRFRGRFELANTGISLIAFRDGTPRIIYLNDTCHLRSLDKET